MERFKRMIDFRIDLLESRVVLGQANLEKYNQMEKTHEVGKMIGENMGNVNNSRDNLNFLKDLKRIIERG